MPRRAFPSSLTRLAALIAIAYAPVSFADTAALVTLQRDTITKDNVYQASYVLSALASDIDNDGYYEAPAQLTGAGPTGGGLIPTNSGAPLSDGYGRALGYCSFDNGATNASTGRINGTLPASNAKPTLVVIAAGMDGVFDTTCASIYAGGVVTGDDYAVSKSAVQVAGGVSGTSDTGKAADTVAILNALDKTSLVDGQMRLVKENNTIYRWNSTMQPAGAWEPIAGTLWKGSGSSIFYTGGNVGIGTIFGTAITPTPAADQPQTYLPLAKLHVSDQVRFDAGINVNGNTFVDASRNVTAKSISLTRQVSAASGISYYSPDYTAWTTYMGPAGETGQGPAGNITAPSGSLVTSWGLRNFIENSPGYGWTWEAGAASGQPFVVAELSSNTGNFRTIGSIEAANVTIGAGGALYGNYGAWTGEANKIQWHSNNLYFQNTGGGNFIFRRGDAVEVALIDNSGNLTATGSVYTPIFYDSNDTGYYVDPNGTSRLNVVNVVGTVAAGNVTIGGNQVLHAGNYNSYALRAADFTNNSSTIIGKRRGRIHTADGTSLNSSIVAQETGFTYGGSGEPAGPFIAFGGLGANIDYSMQMVGAYNGGGNQFVVRTRNDDAGIWNPWRTLLTDGNYSSYALPLTGGTLSGALQVNSTITAQSTTDAQLYLNGNGTSWAGIAWTDVSGTDYTWYNGSTGTFAIGGGGSVVAGKKLHVHGGMTIGSGLAGTGNPTNGLSVEGSITAPSVYVAQTSYVLPQNAGDTWIRLASGSGNSYGRFHINWASNGQHGFLDFTASCNYPNSGQCTINASHMAEYAYTGIKQIRMVRESYVNYYLEVLVGNNPTDANRLTFTAKELTSFSMLSPAVGGIPSGYTAHTVNVENTRLALGNGAFAVNTDGSSTFNGPLSVAKELIVNGQASGSAGNRIIVGAATPQFTLQDTLLRPTIQATGQYPVLSLNHTVTSNSNHGPTVQFTANGVGKQFVIGMTGNGTALDFGFSSDPSWNPHYGIAGLNGTTPIRIADNGYVGIGGSWGAWGTGNPQYPVDIRGNTNVSGNVSISSPITAWNASTPGLGVGNLHLGASSGTGDAGSSITFGARDSSAGATAQAGIYIQSGGNYGTKMLFATTDSYATGAKTALSIDQVGNVAVPRGGLTVASSISSPQLFLNRSSYSASGISYYAPSYTAWSTYMAPAGSTGNGPTGNITAPSGSLVTSWGLRNFIENAPGYGWTWEGGSSSGQPSVVAELSSNTGDFRTIGGIAAGGHIKQGNNLVRPNASWSAAGGSTGAVIIKIPGNTGNYGMIHMEIDVYQYDGNNASKIIVGGHNWNGAWYSYGAQVIGNLGGKNVRLGVVDGQYAVILGDTNSSWSYGHVVVSKVSNGSYYNNTIDMGGNWTVAQTTSINNTWISAAIESIGLNSTNAAFASRMDQDVRKTDAVTFANMTISAGGALNGSYGAWTGEANKIQWHSNSLYFQNTGGGNFYFRRGDGANIATIDNNGSLSASGDMRAPVFYDANDTNYYVDPNATSRLNVINSVDSIRYAGGVGDDNTFGMYFGNDRNADYAIYRESGAWAHPYPDLRIAFHTGIKIGAHASYGGTRFFTNSDMATEIMSVGNGDANVRVANTLIAGNVNINANGRTVYAANSNWGGLLYVGGNGVEGISRSDLVASVNTTNGNLHLDAGSSRETFLNWYSGTGGVNIGNGAGGYGTLRAGNVTIAGNTALHAANFSSYALPLTGGTVTGVTYFRSNKGVDTYVGASDTYALQAFSNDGGPAAMSFHRGGHHAVNMGLDPDNVLRIGGWSAAANRWQLDMAGNQTISGTYYGNGGGLTNLPWANVTGKPTQADWVGKNGFVSELMSWKNYGNSHVIFDASAGTSPSGTAVNNTNAQIPWGGSYPTLMGWNGANTYGVRVDSARLADSASAVAWTGITSMPTGISSFAVNMNQDVRTTDSPTFAQLYTNGWFRNNNANEGIYNTTTGNHFYSESAQFWAVGTAAATYGGIRFRKGHGGELKGGVAYADGVGVGILNDSDNWGLKVNFGGATPGGVLYGAWGATSFATPSMTVISVATFNTTAITFSKNLQMGAKKIADTDGYIYAAVNDISAGGGCADKSGALARDAAGDVYVCK